MVGGSGTTREVRGRRWQDEEDERWTRRIITQSPTSVETSTEKDAMAFPTVSVASGVKKCCTKHRRR